MRRGRQPDRAAAIGIRDQLRRLRRRATVSGVVWLLSCVLSINCRTAGESRIVLRDGCLMVAFGTTIMEGDIEGVEFAWFDNPAVGAAISIDPTFGADWEGRAWREGYSGLSLWLERTRWQFGIVIPRVCRCMINSTLHYNIPLEEGGIVQYCGEHRPLEQWFGLYVALVPLVVPFALCVTILVYAEIRNRLRRRQPHSCADCGYCLIGNLSGRCPECGADVSTKREYQGARCAMTEATRAREDA